MSALPPSQSDRPLTGRAVLAALGITAVAVLSALELTVLGGYLQTFGEVIAGERTAAQNAPTVSRLFADDVTLTVWSGTAWVLALVASVLFARRAVSAYDGKAGLVGSLRSALDRMLLVGWVATLAVAGATELVGDQLMRSSGADREAFVTGARWSSLGNALALVAAVLAIALIVRITARAPR